MRTFALGLLIVLPFTWAACDLVAGVFTLDDTVTMRFSFQGNGVQAGQTITATSAQQLNLLQIVHNNSFTADDVVSARIATVGNRPQIEILGPQGEMLDAFTSAEVRAGNVLILSGSDFPASRTATLNRPTSDITSVVVAGPVGGQLRLVAARPLMNQTYFVDVVFDVVIGVEG